MLTDNILLDKSLIVRLIRLLLYIINIALTPERSRLARYELVRLKSITVAIFIGLVESKVPSIIQIDGFRVDILKKLTDYMSQFHVMYLFQNIYGYIVSF